MGLFADCDGQARQRVDHCPGKGNVTRVASGALGNNSSNLLVLLAITCVGFQVE
jgi:hypothetical protein